MLFALLILNKTPLPFLGHAGIGARFECVESLDRLIIRETVRSLLILVFSLGAVCLLPLWLLMFKPDQIKGGPLSHYLLGGIALFCTSFFIKSIYRLIHRRKIELIRNQQKIIFVDETNDTTNSFHFSDVKSLEINRSFYRSDAIVRENFTIELTTTDGQVYRLCTSENEVNVRAVYHKVEKFWGA